MDSEKKAVTVSVAMCTYNGERFLQQQLDSLASQTRQPDEVVVCDDCSTDNTVAILDRWAESVPFSVRIIRNQSNLGCFHNFENALKNVEGDVVFLADQDDVWHSNKIEVMLNVFEKNPNVGLVFHNTNVIDAAGNDLGLDEVELRGAWRLTTYMRQLSPNLDKHPITSGCCSAIRRTIIQKILPLEELFGHDGWIYLFAPAFADVVTIPDKLISYRCHDSNISVRADLNEQIHHFDQYVRDYYKNEVYLFLTSDQFKEPFLKRVEQAEDSVYKIRLLKYYNQTQSRIKRRELIQRNLFIYSPLFVYELLTFNYWRGFQPMKCIGYDFWTGLKNAFNPDSWKGLLRRLGIGHKS